jgi:hypothetical protein
MPEYEGRVAFVDAVTTEAAAAPVLERFPTQYIPTSVFVGADGEIVETVVGPLTEAELRGYLGALAAGSD